MSEIHLPEKSQQKPDWVYDDLTLNGEYVLEMDEQDITPDTYDDTDPVQLESILAVQALAMGSLRHIARVKLRGDEYNRRHGFAILSESEEGSEAYDGAVEEYMSYRIAKNNFADWTMRVRFRTNTREEEKKNESYLEDFYFAWRRNNAIVAASINRHTVATDGYTSVDKIMTSRPVSNDEVIELRHRMFEHVDNSGAWAEGSFMRPEKETA